MTKLQTLTANELSTILFFMLLQEGIDSDRAWDRADEVEELGHAACVKAIEDDIAYISRMKDPILAEQVFARAYEQATCELN